MAVAGSPLRARSVCSTGLDVKRSPESVAPCRHCGTPCPPDAGDDGFCCAGCGFVYGLIHDQGLEQYYAIKGRARTGPVGNRVFEPRDFTWLTNRVAKAEEKAEEDGEPLASGEFSLGGISCIGCVWLVERLFLRQPGAARAEIHASDGSMALTWRTGECDLRPSPMESGGSGPHWMNRAPRGVLGRKAMGRGANSGSVPRSR